MKSIFAYPYVAWMAVFIVIPLFLMVFFAFTLRDGTFSLDNFMNMANYAPIFGRSLVLALVATVICLLLGYPFAYILSKSGLRSQTTLMMLIVLPMWMNFLLRTYAWLTLLENNGLINRALAFIGLGPIQIINTPAAVVLGMVYNYLPFMILPIYTVLMKLDKRVIEAAQDLGAPPVKVFFKVTLPLSFPGVVSGITMVFVPGVSTFVISKMLGGGLNMMLGDLIDMQFLGNSYNPNLGAAISLVMMIIIVICMAIMNKFDGGNEGATLI